MKLEATATVKANSGTDGDGTAMTTPVPVETTPVPVPVEKPQGTQGGTQVKLAKTGAAPAGLIGTGILVAGGVALAVARYKRR